ncbi:MAG TPA: NAD(P)/FAD-dependent oxidoreductase [Chthoniobacterales bacterium]|nr:NAD(P)/FAD-dependent oxidoreductase [Chthoniobacterales bacterium]
MRREYDAVVVGSGPNGLAAAITLAQAGCSVLVLEANDTIGGGTRSAELTQPAFIHDVCSAVHPLAAGSPFFKSLPLERFGLEWIHPPLPLAHPLENGEAALLFRDLDKTAASLGGDSDAYRELFLPLVSNWDALAHEFLQPMLHMPQHPLTLARFGWRALQPARFLARTQFRTPAARALFGGIAAHSFLRLEQFVSAAFGLVLGAAGHAVGWPIPRRGSQSIANALASYLRELGGEIETGRPMESLGDVPKNRALLLDLSAWQFARIAGGQLPAGYRHRLQRFKHAPAVFKIDYALSAPIPWRNPHCAQAGTVHIGGTLPEIARAEREVAHGRPAERPFVLVAQQSLFDESRAPRGCHTLWAYCHVPFGSDDPNTAARIERQIEHFAPGFRDCILARHKLNAADLAHSNRNLEGGDINGGANTIWQLLARPVLSLTPYRTPLPGTYLCSSSTPPGGGVHGMCGFHAARLALGERFGKKVALAGS